MKDYTKEIEAYLSENVNVGAIYLKEAAKQINALVQPKWYYPHMGVSIQINQRDVKCWTYPIIPTPPTKGGGE